MQIEAGAAAMQLMGHREHRCDSDPPRYKQAIWRLCQRKAIFWKADSKGHADLHSLVHPKRSPARAMFSKYRDTPASAVGGVTAQGVRAPESGRDFDVDVRTGGGDGQLASFDGNKLKAAYIFSLGSAAIDPEMNRSEERREGKESVGTGR